MVVCHGTSRNVNALAMCSQNDVAALTAYSLHLTQIASTDHLVE